MQNHSGAEQKFSKSSVDEFWRVVESIDWPSRKNASAIRMDLMRILSPKAASQCDTILRFYIDELYQIFLSWESKQDEFYGKPANKHDIRVAAGNAVGGGRFEYDQFCLTPNSLLHEITQIQQDNCFVQVFPTDDDYYSLWHE